MIGALAPANGIETNSEGIILLAASINDCVVRSDHLRGGLGHASNIASGFLAKLSSDNRHAKSISRMIEKLSLRNVPVTIGL
ncbi:hypothetical protein ES703_61501 [subsurface metagenome]